METETFEETILEVADIRQGNLLIPAKVAADKPDTGGEDTQKECILRDQRLRQHHMSICHISSIRQHQQTIGDSQKTIHQRFNQGFCHSLPTRTSHQSTVNIDFC